VRYGPIKQPANFRRTVRRGPSRDDVETFFARAGRLELLTSRKPEFRSKENGLKLREIGRGIADDIAIGRKIKTNVYNIAISLFCYARISEIIYRVFRNAQYLCSPVSDENNVWKTLSGPRRFGLKRFEETVYYDRDRLH